VSSDFDALFLTHYQAVFRVAYRLAGTREEAEDLAQETFLRLHRSPAVWQGQENAGRLAAWLYRVVTNLAYNSVRAQSRRRRREDRIMPATFASTDPANVAQERMAVRQALLELPERQVQLLLLRYAGLSYRELAEALDLAPGSVGSLLARAEAAFEKAYRAGEEP